MVLGSLLTPQLTVLQDKLNSSSQMWDQNLYVDGKLVSSVSSSKGQHGNLFYISMECASGTCSTTPAHSTFLASHCICSGTNQEIAKTPLGWHDVQIILSNADESFGYTGTWAQGATGGEMSTSDGGKTWNFATIEVPATNVPSST